MKTRNLYAILEITSDASMEEIKGAYRRLAMRYHPDRYPDADGYKEIFQKIGIAYEILSNEQKRNDYDGYGAEHFDLNEDDFSQRSAGLYEGKASSSANKNKMWLVGDPSLYDDPGETPYLEITHSLCKRMVEKWLDGDAIFVQFIGPEKTDVWLEIHERGITGGSETPVFRVNCPADWQVQFESIGWLVEEVTYRGMITLQRKMDSDWNKTEIVDFAWQSLNLMKEHQAPGYDLILEDSNQILISNPWSEKNEGAYRYWLIGLGLLIAYLFIDL